MLQSHFGATLFEFFTKCACSDISSIEVCAESECTWQPEANMTWREISQIYFEVRFNSGVLLHAMEMERTNIAHFWSDIILWCFISVTAAGLVLPQHFDGFKTSHRGTGSSPCSLLMWLGSVIMHCASPALCIHVLYIMQQVEESIAYCYPNVCKFGRYCKGNIRPTACD